MIPNPMRRPLKWAAVALIALLAIGILLLAAVDFGYFRGAVIRLIEARTGRQIRIEGPLRLHLWSHTPSLIAERVSIGNPPWTPAGIMAEVGKIILVADAPWSSLWSSRGFVMERLELDSATLHLFRDASGHANWQLTNPDKGAAGEPPIIHSISILEAHVLLDDAQKRRQFDGIVSAGNAQRSGEAPLQIDGKGLLNGKEASLQIIGDPLSRVQTEAPYAFTFDERSSGSRLTAEGSLLHGLNLQELDATFEATGADLRDMYYLTGTRFLDTGRYRLSGKFARRGNRSAFSDLIVTSGQSSVRGSVSSEAKGGRTKVEVNLSAPLLRTVDLGARAAGREPEPDPALDVAALRRSDAIWNVRAERIEAGPVTLHAVTARMSIDHGVLEPVSLSADMLGGKLELQVKIDVRNEVPAEKLDLTITAAQLGQLAVGGTAVKGTAVQGVPAIEGPLAVRARLIGRGKSVHQVAASASGSVTATMVGGSIRDSLAELTGVDLRGLGLLLTKSKKQAAIRCGVARFQGEGGIFAAQTLLIDTDPVLIAGEGGADLNTDTLDFVLRGYPKSLRILKLNSPIQIKGSFAHPSIGLETRSSKLVLIDRGKTADVDCVALLREAGSQAH